MTEPAAEAVVQGVLSCAMPGPSADALRRHFTGVSLRLCLTAAAREHVLVSSNLLQEGPITFAPVGGATSFARGAALQRAPTFASGSDRVAAHSDLAVASRQDACTAFFCVPCVANALSGPSSTSAAPSYEDDASVGALLLGFPSEAQVVREDLRSCLLLAQCVADRHLPALRGLVASVAPALRQGGHASWGLAGGLLRPAPGSPARPAGSEDSHSDDSSDEGSDDEGSERPGGVLDPAQYALLQRLDAWTLSFLDERVEQ